MLDVGVVRRNYMARKQFGHRKDIKFPLHSQRISGIIFDNKSFTISRTVLINLGVLPFFPPDSASSPWDTKIKFNKKTFDVQVATQTDGRVNKGYVPLHRIYTTPDLIAELKRTFISTYARHLEASLREKNGEDYDELSIDSFHEFVDIEFDLKNNLMKWKAHFKVQPVYRELFAELANNSALHLIEHSIKGKIALASTDWDLRNNRPPKTPNVIYYLRDDVNKLLYVGKGGSSTGTDRIFDPRPSIPNWTHFRYDVLPAGFDDKLVEIFEEMQIRLFAYYLENHPTQGTQRQWASGFSNYKLTNLRIIP